MIPSVCNGCFLRKIEETKLVERNIHMEWLSVMWGQAWRLHEEDDCGASDGEDRFARNESGVSPESRGILFSATAVFLFCLVSL